MFQPIWGIFIAGSSGVISFTSPAIQPKPRVIGLFQTALRHKLHADADTQKRSRLADRDLVDRLDHAGDGIEARPAVGIGAHTWQHDAIGRAHPLGACRQLDLER